MPPSTLITTPGAVDANAYVSEAEADQILTDRLYASAWTDAGTDARSQAILWATRILDQAIDWYGAPATTEQRLRCPRVGWVDQDGRTIDQDTIPDLLKQATAEMALELLRRDRAQEPEVLGLGISQGSIGGALSATIDRTMVLGLVPDSILVLLAPLGRIADVAARGLRTVRLERT